MVVDGSASGVHGAGTGRSSAVVASLHALGEYPAKAAKNTAVRNITPSYRVAPLRAPCYGGRMRVATCLPIIVLLAACATQHSAASRPLGAEAAQAAPLSESQSPSAKSVPHVSGAAGARFFEKRAEIAALSTEHDALRIVVAAKDVEPMEEVVALPLDRRASAVATLIVVGVFDGYARIGAVRASTDAELHAAAEAAAHASRPVALMRVDDGAHLADVVRVAHALRDGGIDIRVLGSVAPTSAPPTRKWDACPFPAASDDAAVDKARVVVVVDDDGAGHPGVVHVKDSPGYGFPWAGAVCASMQEYGPSTAPAGSPRFGRPLAITFMR
ncbi:MAG: hypothetical protein JWP87_816 [Labilithrix sp.]|nr:hypothetical protein [Labilithrix sp.]